MGEVSFIVTMATIAIVACILFLSWVLVRKPSKIQKLHDEVIDSTTKEVLEACLAYGHTRLAPKQYERFKTYLTEEITNGAGGMTLAKLVEDCIDRAQEDEDEPVL